ncbi:MAG: TIGR02186 family protein [Pseudomonadota bacterium]
MRRLALILSVMVSILASASAAEEIVAGLSQDEISITANFDGSEIIIFGAVSREAPIPEGTLGVIITVAGPDRPVTVRRKERRFGIWVNTETAEIDAAPTFYAIATNAPLDEVLHAVEDLRHRVSIPVAIRAVDTGVLDQEAFVDAIARIRQDNDLYQLLEGAVEVRQQTLFDTRIRLPANLTEGDYLTRIFLTRDREVVAVFETEIAVRKVGLERLIYRLAYDQPLVYGILALTIAIAAGWAASAAFRLIWR